MKLDEPIGDASYAPFFLRVTLGAYLLLAGLAKADNLQGFVNEWQKLGGQLFSHNLATIYAVVLVVCELIAGGLLVIGLWSILGGILATFVMISFVFVGGVFVGQGQLLNSNVILSAAAVSVLFLGGGAFSIDRFRKSG